MKSLMRPGQGDDSKAFPRGALSMGKSLQLQSFSAETADDSSNSRDEGTLKLGCIR